MERKIVKIEEVPEEKKGLFKVAKAVGKATLKAIGGIIAAIVSFYAFLALNPDIGRVVEQTIDLGK